MKKLVVLLTIFILGCSNSRVEEERPKKIITNPKPYDFIIEEQYPNERPSWTYNLTEAKSEYNEYELFTGISTFAKDEYEATKIARGNAINQIGAYIGVYIESKLETRSYKETTNNNEEYDTKVEEQSSQLVETLVNNLKLLEKYVEKGVFYDPRGFWRPYTRVIVLYGVKKSVLK